MRIGILTHPLAENHGGILQAVSLCGYLKMQGHDVILLRRHINRPKWKKIIISILENIPFQNIKNYRYCASVRRKQKPFIDKYLPEKTPIVYTTSELKSLAEKLKFDAVIVGSDQVWRMKYIDDGHYGNYFLDFVNSAKTKKIAYAASFGSDKWESPDKTGDARRLLREFSAVSVREASGVGICCDLFDRTDCELVLDPTLLVERDFHESIVKSQKAINTPGVFTYILDKSSRDGEVFNKVMSVLSRNYDVNNRFDVDRNFLTAGEWLSSIKNAEFVVTDSFHGMAFSVIFQKKFIALGNERRGMARFNSLSKILGLENRVITSVGQVDEKLLDDIDYTVVNQRVLEMREKSGAFLRASLQQAGV